MTRIPYRLALALALLAAACARVPAQARDPDLAHDLNANEAAMRAMGGAARNEGLHMVMTAPRAPAPGDSARAARIVAQMGARPPPSRDVRGAERDGFVRFLPGVELPVFHFPRRMNALEA